VPAGIYGVVICAATLASAGNYPAGRVAATVLVTLLAYWLAERYSELLGLASREREITRADLVHVLGSGWAMIQASVTPLLVLLLSRLAGASSAAALDAALAYTVFLLVVLGWLAARRAGLDGWQRWSATAFAGLLGLIVVALKASLH
jgi:positive regulator of sigma E activity